MEPSESIFPPAATAPATVNDTVAVDVVPGVVNAVSNVFVPVRAAPPTPTLHCSATASRSKKLRRKAASGAAAALRLACSATIAAAVQTQSTLAASQSPS